MAEELTEEERRVLAALVALERDRKVLTVQAAAIHSGVEYTIAYEAMSRLLTKGLIQPWLRATDAGVKAAA